MDGMLHSTPRLRAKTEYATDLPIQPNLPNQLGCSLGSLSLNPTHQSSQPLPSQLVTQLQRDLDQKTMEENLHQKGKWNPPNQHVHRWDAWIPVHSFVHSFVQSVGQSVSQSVRRCFKPDGLCSCTPYSNTYIISEQGKRGRASKGLAGLHMMATTFYGVLVGILLMLGGRG
jgi:hypothetical protein